jgi:nucleoside-diphosphate-sugar epimerase
MRILVTGGAGFIGSHLVERLARDRAGEIVVMDNLRRGRTENLEVCRDRITFLQADIRDRDALGEAMRGCELVFHLAAQSNVIGAVQDVEYSFTSNVDGTFNVLLAGRAVGIKRIVFTSSREVYGDPKDLPVPETAPVAPKNAYGASKVAGEVYCRVLGEQSPETVILRLANVYGTRDRDRVIPIFVDNALRGEPLVLYGGKQILDLVWIDTVVDALLRAGFGDRIREPVNIGSGKGTPIADLARRVLETAKSASEIQVAPSREMEVARFTADITRAHELFGIEQPADPLSHLPKVVEWMRVRIGKGTSA